MQKYKCWLLFHIFLIVHWLCKALFSLKKYDAKLPQSALQFSHQSVTLNEEATNPFHNTDLFLYPLSWDNHEVIQTISIAIQTKSNSFCLCSVFVGSNHETPLTHFIPMLFFYFSRDFPMFSWGKESDRGMKWLNSYDFIKGYYEKPFKISILPIRTLSLPP